MEAGADLAATSVHKLGGSMTQSSVLNMKEGLISRKRYSLFCQCSPQLQRHIRFLLQLMLHGGSLR